MGCLLTVNFCRQPLQSRIVRDIVKAIVLWNLFGSGLLVLSPSKLPSNTKSKPPDCGDNGTVA